MGFASDGTGLGPLETAVLVTLVEMGATPKRPTVKSARVVRKVADSFGFGPRYVYEVLCDLGRPWLISVPLVDPLGNFGSADYPAAEPAVTECRLSAVGWLAAKAELGEISPLPVGLINGTIYQGGVIPPFSPDRIVLALIEALDDPGVSNAQLASLAGAPVFPGGCEVGGDIGRVVDGDRAVLVQRSRVTAMSGDGRRWIDVTRLPPSVGSGRLADYLTARAEGEVPMFPGWLSVDDQEPPLPFDEVVDLTFGDVSRTPPLVRCYLARTADAADCLGRLRNEPGVNLDLEAQLPRPLGELLRAWAEDHRVSDTPSGLQQLGRLLP